MKMIQLRNVPDSLYRKLKIRAIEQRQSLSDYLINEITEIADKPTLDELWQKIERSRVKKFDSAKIIQI